MNRTVAVDSQVRPRVAGRGVLVIAAAALIVALLLAVVFAPGLTSSMFTNTLHQFAHAPIFGCIAVLLLFALRQTRWSESLSITVQYLLAFGGAVLLGLLTEAIQGQVGRDAEYADAVNDALGAVAFLAARAAFERSVRSSLRVLMAALAVLLVGYSAAPVVHAAYEYSQRRAQFPTIADFAQSQSMYFLSHPQAAARRAQLPGPLARYESEQALRIEFGHQRYPGITFDEPQPDWSGYSSLHVDASNPTDDPLTFVLRVHDRAHDQRLQDRYNQRFTIPPGRREVLRIALTDIERAPEGRPMDLRRIAGIVLFRTEESTAEAMFVSRVWLE